MYSHNAAERAIRTCKAHFLSTLAGMCAQLPKKLWDQLLEHNELTLNIMRQATAYPRKSAWEYLHDIPFNYYATPLAPLGIPVIIHNKPGQ